VAVVVVLQINVHLMYGVRNMSFMLKSQKRSLILLIVRDVDWVKQRMMIGIEGTKQRGHLKTCWDCARNYEELFSGI